jgi:hypothetical protein
MFQTTNQILVCLQKIRLMYDVTFCFITFDSLKHRLKQYKKRYPTRSLGGIHEILVHFFTMSEWLHGISWLQDRDMEKSKGSRSPENAYHVLLGKSPSSAEDHPWLSTRKIKTRWVKPLSRPTPRNATPLNAALHSSSVAERFSDLINTDHL